MTVKLVYERAIRNYAEQQKVKVSDSSWSLKHHETLAGVSNTMTLI
jgi:hypothetical protein